MKMKKIILFFSMIAVFVSLTACSSGQEEVTFDYNNTDIIYSTAYQAYQFQNISNAYRAYLENSEEEMAQVMLTGISNFDSAREECGEFKGYRSKEGGDSIMFDFSKLNSQDENELAQLNTELTDFLSLIEAKVEENGGNVTVTLTAVHEKRDVEYSFVYEENPAYAYAYALYEQRVAPYQIKEITATPDYTFSEKMGKAGANTLMGMGTVFIVLIFISIIIGQFEKVGKASEKIAVWWRNRKKKAEEPEDAFVKPAAVSASTTAPNLMDDAQLVAVITAAVAAANSSSGGSDKLIVRSIRKAKR